MTSTWIAFLLAFLAGAFLLVTPFWANTPWLRKQATFKLERLGLDVTAESRTLLILAGALLILGSGHAIYTLDRGKLNDALAEAQAKEKVLEQTAAEVRGKLLEGEKNPLRLSGIFEGVDAAFLKNDPTFFDAVDLEALYLPPRDTPLTVENDDLRSGKNNLNLLATPSPTGILLTAPEIPAQARLSISGTRNEQVWHGNFSGLTADLCLELSIGKHEIEEG